jgi:hypothetical protein
MHSCAAPRLTARVLWMTHMCDRYTRFYGTANLVFEAERAAVAWGTQVLS